MQNPKQILKTLTNIIKEYLYRSKVFIDDENFTLHLYSNPHFPTVKSISDTFDYFNIANVVANVPKEALDQLPKSFLALITYREQDEVVMVTRKKNSIKVNGQSLQKSLSIDDFFNIWKGTIIAVEEGNDDKSNATTKVNAYIAVLSVLLVTIQLFQLDLAIGVLSCLMLIGSLLSLLIIREETGFRNSVVKKVCNTVNNNGGCERVIRSADSKFFGFISLSTAAAAYFSSGLLVVNLLGINTTFLFFTSLLGLPLVAYSLYSQAFRLKQWCVLCLGISLLFFINLAISTYLFYSGEASANQLYFIQASLLMVTAYISIEYPKTLVRENKNLKGDQLVLYKLKKDLNIFKAVLDNSIQIDNSVFNIHQKMSFGSESPILELDAFTNPTCGFCSDSFIVYYKLLKADNKKIRVNVMFNVPFENTQSISTKIAAKAVNLYSEGKKEEALEMLYSWYTNRNIQEWLKLYDESTVVTMTTNQTLEVHKYWAKSNGINYTPATVVNGRIFPDKYKIEDLLLLANDFILEKEKKTLVMEKV